MTLFGPIAILIIAALGIYISACTLLNGRPIGIAVLLEEIVIPFAEAQTLDIYGQLKAGSRHFDLRPFEANQDDEDQCSEGLCSLTKDKFYFHHTAASRADSEEIFGHIRGWSSWQCWRHQTTTFV